VVRDVVENAAKAIIVLARKVIGNGSLIAKTPSILSTTNSHIKCQNPHENLTLNAKSQTNCHAILLKMLKWESYD
jgi:hypothetical protein